MGPEMGVVCCSRDYKLIEGAYQSCKVDMTISTGQASRSTANPTAFVNWCVRLYKICTGRKAFLSSFI